MSQYRIATPAGAVAGGYDYEMEALAGMGAEIFEVPATEADFIKGARDADAIYAKGMNFTKPMIDSLLRCRGIALGSVGVDYVDVAAATARGIPVTNCPDTFIEEVADHAMTLLLGGFRRLVEQDRMVRDGRWRDGRPQLSKFPRLMGSTLGFVAFGHVARAMALRARPFGLRMVAYDPFIEELVMPPYGVEPATLEEVLTTSDFVSMHAPATPEAMGMLGEKHFRMMKPGALFINTGRGATVDEAAMITALQQGWIAGAALDVLAQEPPRQDNPLLKMDNVILTAHARFDPARRRRVGQELALLLAGRWPLSCVNPTVLASSDLRRWQPYSMERGPNS
jgi:D-3-phosphoglycerate dehydrogenase